MPRRYIDAYFDVPSDDEKEQVEFSDEYETC